MLKRIGTMLFFVLGIYLVVNGEKFASYFWFATAIIGSIVWLLAVFTDIFKEPPTDEATENDNINRKFTDYM